MKKSQNLQSILIIIIPSDAVLTSVMSINSAKFSVEKIFITSFFTSQSI